MNTQGLKLLCLLYLLSTSFCDAQDLQKNFNFEYTAQYKQSYKIDSNQASYTTENFILLFNKSQSAFRSVSRFLLDSVQRTEEYQNLPQMQRISIAMQYPTKHEYIVYTNLDKKETTFTTFAEVLPEMSPSYKEMLDMNWSIQEEFEMVAGYRCQKATIKLFGRNWTAWFSKEYAYKTGPYKFYGLPGLIIKIQDATKSYKFELIKITKETLSFPTAVHQNVKLLSKEESIDIFKKGRYGMSMYADMPMLEGDRYINIEKRKNSLKLSENNPLELIP